MILKCLLMFAVLFIIEVELLEYFDIKFSRAECQILDRQILHNISCKSRIINRTRIESFEFTFQPGIQLDNLHFMTILYYKFGTVYRPSLIKIEQELCGFLRNRNSSKIFPIVEDMWSKHGNMLDSCPLSGRRYLKDVVMNFENFPAQIVPAGEWRMDISTSTIINNIKTKVYLQRQYYEVKVKTALQWKKK